MNFIKSIGRGNNLNDFGSLCGYFSDAALRKAEAAEMRAVAAFGAIKGIAEYNQIKVIRAMQECGVSDAHFAGTTGYGYGDRGREVLDEVFARVFGAEAAMVRQQIICGTQAIAICLYGNLNPGDELLSITGKPYDTLEEVIGIRGGGAGSLKAYNIGYREVGLTADGSIDFGVVSDAMNNRTKMVFIQRSRGYSQRAALSVQKIAAAAEFVKKISPGVIVMVDNCYGEFVETHEPVQVGADLMAGSLIKNPGGGIAPTGGYIAGREEYVQNASYRLTAPGLGGHVGPTLGNSRLLFQGLYLAPHVVAESLMGMVFCAALMENEGYCVSPGVNDKRADIIQSVTLNDSERLIAFCRGIQKGSAVDSFVEPEPWPMPGYEHPVIMASGSFVQGSSIELSADGPMTPPYIAYVQGGLVYESVKIGCLSALENLLKLTK
jgi:cystathionine beta-lyase family protein involved in aluminum resistance